jgi:hypothetical protein
VISDFPSTAPTWPEIVGLLRAVLVWPVAAVVIVLILRNSLKALLGRLLSYEGMGQKLTFDNHLALAEEATEMALPPGVVPESPEPESNGGGPAPHARGAERVRSPAKGDSRSLGKEKAFPRVRLWARKRLSSTLVLTAWEKLSSEIMLVAMDLDPTFGRKWSTPRGQALDRLVTLGVVTSSFSDAVGELRAARNQVAHDGYEPTSSAGRAYSTMVRDLSEDLRRAADAYVRPED